MHSLVSLLFPNMTYGSHIMYNGTEKGEKSQVEGGGNHVYNGLTRAN